MVRKGSAKRIYDAQRKRKAQLVCCAKNMQAYIYVAQSKCKAHYFMVRTESAKRILNYAAQRERKAHSRCAKKAESAVSMLRKESGKRIMYVAQRKLRVKRISDSSQF
jgi:hypothetical protein